MVRPSPITYEEAKALKEQHPYSVGSAVRTVHGRQLELFTYYLLDHELFASNPKARDLRGCTFDVETGELVSLPFEKFFNVNEHELITEDKLTFKGRIYDKADGSMVQVTSLDGVNLLVASRMSLDGYVNKSVTRFLRTMSALVSYIHEYQGVTFLFEYLDPNQPIVVVPEVEQLVFLNARSINTGEYLFDEHVDFIPCRSVSHDVLQEMDWPLIMLELETVEDTEGYVMWLDSEQTFFKVKSLWYRENHRLVSHMKPRHFLESWAEGTIDDRVAVLRRVGNNRALDDLRLWVQAAEDLIKEHVEGMVDVVLKAEQYGWERKQIALELNDARKDPVGNLVFANVMYAYRDGYVSDVARLFNNVRESYGDGRKSRVKQLVESCAHKLRVDVPVDDEDDVVLAE